MKQALGLVEIQGMSTAVVVADTMAKAANVQILEIENTKGLGYMTIKIVGDVGAVNAAVDAGRQVGSMNQKLISWKVIPRPSDYVEYAFSTPKPTNQTAEKAEISLEENKELKVEKEPVQEKADAIKTEKPVEEARQEQPAEAESKTEEAPKKSGTTKKKK